ncbi:MAG: anti-sigma factor antagonist [Acidimicrobiaceae bacterium]|jgi:anti-sigma B factor antagonist|nr:anti-sigma factor antagonist [Acidimicrobiaceae bacterium]MDQ1367631.1 anti-sigma factor antagonist [Acidimicrobiaceae bacterium]MDQ1370963.1 anti-sigma factor antagonist [Acidimicrobiaceae bacterium]MDQ1378047.1 anti-sigma factor antagonist [Acidimicrobiaceae bacterium]MDQ1400642.1 anti-sigma factor antagonist [Acidimicrobiaceae bacterium]
MWPVGMVGIMEFGVVVDRTGDQARVIVRGELDMFTSSALRKELVDLINDGARDVTVDLKYVEFVDSTALGVLVGAMKRLRALDGDLTLASPNPSTRKVLDITGLDRILTVTSEEDGARLDGGQRPRTAVSPDPGTAA